MSIEAMKLALEYLEESDNYLGSLDHSKPIAALRQAIEQAEKQEPVAIYQYQLASGSWIDQTKNSYDYNVRHGQATVRVVYTTPQPQREWVGLTDEEMQQACYETFSYDPYVIAHAIEAKIKERNT